MKQKNLVAKRSLIQAVLAPVKSTLLTPLKSSAPARLASILSATLVIGIMIFSSVNPAVVSAFSVYNQSDWSGGTGSDPSNQYQTGNNVTHSTAGEITPANVHSDWCSTANCDSNWTRRRAVWIDNYDGHLSGTDRQIKIDIPYDPDMQADFDDIRFVNSAGDTDIDHHFIYWDYDNTVAIVKVPTIAPNAVTEFYMYYGNASASSSDSIDAVNFADGFSSGGVLGPQWTAGGSYSLNGDELTFSGYGNTVASTADFDRSNDRMVEADIKVDLSGINCEDFAWTGNMYATTYLSVTFAKPTQCDSGNKYHSIINKWREDISSVYDVQSPVNMYDDTYYRVRALVKASGGTDYYVSTDGGASFSSLNADPSDETENSRFKMFIEGVPVTLRNVVMYDELYTTPVIGVEQFAGGKTGYFITPFYDMGSANTQFGDINLTTSGGTVMDTDVFAFTADSPVIGVDPRFCGVLESGQDINDSTCAENGHRYIAFLIFMSGDSSGDYALSDIDFEYLEDSSPPPTNASNIVIKKNAGSATISEGSWSNDNSPFFSWDAGEDGPDESGIKGYCLYLGTESSADPASTQGILPGSSPLDVNNACPYAVSGTELDLSSSVSMNTPETYYFSVKAIDNLNFIYTGSAAQTNYKYDGNDPFIGTLFTAPAVTNTKEFRVTWLTNGGANAYDNESGLAGMKYCVTNMLIGMSGCNEDDNNWYGTAHTGSGSVTDTSDVIDFSEGSIVMKPADAARLDDSIAFVNFVFISGIDYAGNVQGPSLSAVVVTNLAAGAPSNLQVTPTSNTANAFSFNWDPPSGGGYTYFGDESTLDYCWSVNEPINENATNCNWTGQGIETLASGPYATQQGTNTLYMITKDQSGNVNNDNVASVTFSASTTAPGAPQDLEISDVSTRATSSWKLAMSWSEPDQPGAGISSYRIYRSTDNSNFTQVGSTSNANLSFIDSGLNQLTYYYHIKACDNAGSCGVASNVASRLPTGRFTSPAKLTADTDQPKVKDIGTRKATIYWFTDRESDSKIAYGTKSGTYLQDETGNSTQTSNHSVNLSNLQPGTTYYYIAKWTDGDGNTGTSTERSFTTEPAPTVSEVEPLKVSITSADIKFKTKNASKVTLLYGKSEGFGGIQSINTSIIESFYTLSLSDLDDGTKYFFKLNTVDADGNDYSGDVYSFTTPARPRISNLRFQPVEGSPSSTQKVSWTTNVPATSALTYQQRGGVSKEVIDSKLVTEHELTIQGLEDDSDYSLIARSVDGAGNAAVSDTQTFRTALDTRAPKISDLNVETSIRGTGSEARGQIIVSWKTDEKASSQVAFGPGQSGAFTNQTPVDNKLTTEHVVIVSDLATSSIYRVQAISTDKANNAGNSESQSAIIGRGSENVFSIIFNALQKIFGVGG